MSSFDLAFRCVLRVWCMKCTDRTERGQVVANGPQHVDGRLVEREEPLERLAADGVGPGEALAVVLEVSLDGLGLRDGADPGQHDVVEVRFVLEQGDVLEPVVGDDVLDAHLGFEGLLCRADRPDGQAVRLRQPVGKHDQRLLVLDPLVVGPVLHEQRHFVEDQQAAPRSPER